MPFSLIWKIPYFLIMRMLLLKAGDGFWKIFMAGRVLKVEGRRLKPQAQALINLQGMFSAPVNEWTPQMVRGGYEKSMDLFDGPKVPVSNIEDIDIPLEGRVLKGRFYGDKKSSANRSALLYFHGGGFVIGSLNSHDRLCRKLAKATDQPVIAVDYRLGPENRFPAAFEDALDVWQWLQRHAENFDIDPEKIVVSGDSAGAALALLISAETSKGNIGTKPAGSGLIYPPLTTNPETSSRSLLSKEKIVLTSDLMDWFSENFFADDLIAADKYLEPLKNAVTGNLNPTWILTCGFDPLREDGVLIANRLKALNTDVEIKEYDSLYHGFIGASAIFPEVDKMVQDLALFIKTKTGQRSDIKQAIDAAE